MKRIVIAFVLGIAFGAFAADTNIPWQFTGATNRTASVSLPRPVNDFVPPPATVALDIPYFDSLLPGFQALSGQCLSTLGPGFVLFVH